MGRRIVTRLAVALAILISLSFAIEPLSDQNFPTSIDATINIAGTGASATHIVTAKISFLETSFYQQLIPKNYHNLQPRDFYKPPLPGAEYSTESYSSQRKPLPKAQLYFTYNGYKVSGCYPAPDTADDGSTTCTVDYYQMDDGHGGQAAKKIEEESSCGAVSISFTGTINQPGQPSAIDYKSSQTGIMLCPQNNAALSAFGTSIWASFTNKIGVCFPALLLLSMLIASMYYSGRDPLSLFDLTVPRLPKVRQFRVKGGTSPQMIRSVARKYFQIQGKAESDARKALAAMINIKARDEKLGTQGARRLRREADKEASQIFKELRGKIAKGGLTDSDIQKLNKDLQNLFNNPRYTPGAGSKAWAKYSSAAASLLDMYNKAFQAMKTMGEARGATGNIISRGWTTKGGKTIWAGTGKIMDALTRASVNFESSTAVRFVGRIPLLRGIIAAPTKALDTFAQYRGSRQGAMVIRREVMGGALYTAIGRTKAYDKLKGFVSKGGIGKAAKWLYNWDFEAFEKRHNMFARRFRELFDPLENQRMLTIYTHNKMYEELLARLWAALGSKREKAIEALNDLEKNLKGSDDKTIKLRAELDKLKERILKLDAGEAAGANMDRHRAAISQIENDYKALANSVTGNKNARISLGDWYAKEKEFADIASARIGDGRNYKYHYQSDKLNALYDLVKTGKRVPGITDDDLKIFRRFEQEVVRLVLLTRMENDLYRAVNWGDLRTARNNNDPELNKKFGIYANMAEDKFKAAERVMRTRLLGDLGKDDSRITAQNILANDRNNLTTSGRTLIALRERINANLDAEYAKKYAKDPKKGLELAAMLRYNMTGLDPTAFYLTKRLQQLGIADGDGHVTTGDGRKLKIGRLDDFEVLFGVELTGDKKKARQLLETWWNNPQSEKGRDALKALGNMTRRQPDEQLLRQLAAAMGASTPDEAFRRLLADANNFVGFYNVQTARTVHAFFGDNEERRAAIGDITGAKYMYRVKNEWAGTPQQMEMSAQRAKFGFAGYDQTTATLLNNLRAFDTMAGFLSWGKQHGGSWGSSSMGLFDSLTNYNRDNLKILEKFYANLTAKDSRYYVGDPKKDRPTEADPKITYTQALEKTGGFNAAAYELLMQRGYTFADVKNGLAYVLRGDNRGGTVLLEYDKKVLGAQGKDENGVVKKGDVRDLAPLLARLSESYYIDLPSNVRILIKHGEGANAAWLEGNPFKDINVSGLYNQAYGNKMRRGDISDQLAGIVRDSNGNVARLDTGSQMLKVVASADLKYMRSNPDGFFGNLTAFDRGRASANYLKNAITGKFSEVFYSALDHRSTKMHDWYAAQYQVRQAIDAYAHLLEDNYGTKGSGRLNAYAVKYDQKDLRDEDGKLIFDGYRLVSGARLSPEEYDARVEEMKKIQDHDTSAQFRRNVASKTAKEVAEAESKVYAAGLELKAIEQQYKAGKIGASDYSSQKSAVQTQLKAFAAEEKQARRDYGALSDIIVGWAGSHEKVPYGSARSIYTSFTPLARHFDSKYVDGMRYDFYWATESSVMRDPRTAIGAGGFGLDYSFYVGYQTGQTTYERARFYMTNAMWESQHRYAMNAAQFVHKWFNPMVSQMARDASHYPSYMEMHPLYPGEAASKKFMLAPVAGAPLRRHYSSDFVRTRAQQAIDFFGANAIQAYQQTHESGFIKNTLDRYFTASSHYSTDARMSWTQRNLDQFSKLDRMLFKEESADYKSDDAKAARDAYQQWKYSEAGSAEEKAALRDMDKYVDIRDRRPLGVQRGVSGSDMDEDGSRNRFMNLYVGFHENIWKPTVPGMQDVDPITGHWKPFPQVAAHVDRAEELRRDESGALRGSRLDNFKSLAMAKAESEYVRDASGQTIKDDQGNPVEVWKLNYGDAFATHSDATRETYKRDSTSLLHLMKYQREMMMYSPLNTPSLLYFNPLYGMAWLGSRHLHAGTRFMPTSSVELSHAYGAPTEFSAETIASPFLSRAPFGIGSRSRYMWAQRWNLMKENLKSDLYISRIFTFRLGRKGKYPGVEAYLETMDSLY